MSGTLYIVATPIGNLEDITFRALRMLKEVDLIAAEDTRRTGKLLKHFGIETPLTSYFEHNESAKGRRIIAKLSEGKNVAVVSDAGTPGVSDPGFRLVRDAVAEGIRVLSLPGPSAVLSALALSGLPMDIFSFRGFVPRTDGKRRDFFLAMKAEQTFVIYETARRLKKSLKIMAETIPLAEVVVAREMTKMHEEALRGTALSILTDIGDRDLKGEIVVCLRTAPEEVKMSSVTEELKRLLETGHSVSDAARTAAKEFGLKKRDLYQEAIRLKEE